MCVGDPYRLRQVLLNLMSNAIKFSHRHSRVHVHVSVEDTDCQLVGSGEVCQRLRFAVIDSGIGMPKDSLDLLFQPFSQLDSSTTRKFEGSGLGLAICKKLVKLMNGRVGVESELGKGSTFWFTLNMPTAAPPPEAHWQELAGPLRGKVVALAMEDSPTRDTLAAYLAAWKVRTRVSDCSEEGLHTLAAEASNAVAVFAEKAELVPAMAGAFTGLDRIGRLVVERFRGRLPQEDKRAVFLAAPLRFMELLSALLQAVTGTRLHMPPRRRSTPEVSMLSRTLSCVASPPTTPRSHKGPRILLAEDNAVNRALILKQLATYGYTNTAAVANGKLAVEAACASRFDLILMDCHMPEMDGYRATSEIRRFEQESTAAPTAIVALTADAMEGTRDRCLAAGMDDYYAKPLRRADVLSILDGFLAGDIS